jgi:adenine-specific DNA-methyltransferase
MVLRKCPKEPIFTYTDFDCYVSQSFFIIQSQRINLKYLTGLLNSKLIAFWLRHKGKMQGNNYQLDKEPLLEIPIYKPHDTETRKIILLVDEILTGKKQGHDTTSLELQIDALVYQLYDLTPDEIAIVENSAVSKQNEPESQLQDIANE